MAPFPLLSSVVHALALALAAGAPSPAPTATPLLAASTPAITSTAEDTVLATLAARGDATEFLGLIELVGAEAVFPDGEYTLVAPSDAAVRAVPAFQSRALLEPTNRDELLAVLRHHVVGGRLDLEEFGRDPRRASMHGTDLALRQAGDGGYLVDAGRLIATDIGCIDGVLHVVDEMLSPAGLGLMDEAAIFGKGRHIYTVDLVHSTVLFRVIHMGVGAQWGQFRSFAGEITYDHDDPSNSEIVLAIDATTIDTGNDSRDAYLQVPDFFDTANHPGITYRSTKVTERGDGVLDVEGVLSMRGVDVVTPCRVQTLGQGRFGKTVYKVGFEAELTVKRSDFGMSYGIPGVAGDEVRLIVALEADRDLPADAGR